MQHVVRYRIYKPAGRVPLMNWNAIYSPVEMELLSKKRMDDAVKDNFRKTKLSASTVFNKIVGSGTKSMLGNIKWAVTGFNIYAPRSSYKSHRKGYVLPESAKEKAKEIKNECTAPNACAFLMPAGEREKTISSNFSLGKMEEPRYHVRCAGLHDGNGVPFDTKEMALRYLNEQGSKGECAIRAVTETRSFEVLSDERQSTVKMVDVEYFTLKP